MRKMNGEGAAGFHRTSAERVSRGCDVAGDLRFQRIEAVESLLVAQSPHKTDLEIAAVKIGVEVEEMHFE